ncbi:DUF6049 family protein [Antribacter sp. KLBMP9083]|uniref:DUF6049 family protein n=1 Tax=Antribacter soli TaxID=2910976 RepID=A0AA41QBJ7_9MICO|nr:DUF6049 family protein [Antribacter soli]MCF4120430.1 DUF6049 family protein [Antribacter soli]
MTPTSDDLLPSTSRRRPGRTRLVALAALLAGSLSVVAPTAAGAVAGPTSALGSGASVAQADGAAPAAEEAVAVTDPVTVELVEIDKPVARGTELVTITARVTNNQDVPLEGARAELRLNFRTVTDPETLAEWISAPLDTSFSGTRGGDQQPVPTLAPGESATMVFQYNFGKATMQGWGPRQLAVTVSDGTGRLGRLRSFVVYDSQDGSAPGQPVDLSIALPVTGPALDPADATAQVVELARQAAEGGRLDRLLQVAETGTVALAVDPATVAVAATATGSDMGPLHAWADEITAAGDGTSVFALPAYDPDLGALAHSGIGVEATSAFLAAPLPQGWSAPASWQTNLAWPADGVRPDLATVSTAFSAGRNLVVVGAGALAPVESTTTPSGLAPVAVDGGQVATALVSDEVLTDALVAGTNLTTAQDSGGDAAAEGEDAAAAPAGAGMPTAQALQLILAELAAVAAQPGDPQHLFIGLPRDWKPDVAAYENALTTLVGSGLVRIAPLAELLAGPVPATPREPLADEAPQSGELSPDVVGSLERVRTQVAAFSSVAGDNAPVVTADVNPRLVAPLAVTYRDADPARGAAVTAAVDHAHATLAQVAVVPRVGINFLTSAGSLPVRIRNDLPVDAVVTVALRPDDLRLQVQGRPQEVIPAHSEKDVLVPVRALGAGIVDVTVDVLTPSEQRIGVSSFEVRVNAEWEAIGTWIGGGLIALLFVAGIWRTVRRGRSPYRATSADVEAATGEVKAAATAAATPGSTTEGSAAPAGPAHARQQ